MHGKRRRRSPLKQDKIPSLTDKELDESLKRMNARADAIEQMKNIGKLPGKADDGMRIYKEGDTIHRNVTFNNNDPVQKEWARTNKNWKKMKK
jgi:hypothetical protein